MIPISLTQTQFVNATSKSPYDSGYDHGCDDADISYPDDRYINQPDKGPSYHTNEFMSGYNDGYDNCSEGFGQDVSSSDDNDDKGDEDSDDNDDEDVVYCEGQRVPEEADSCYDQYDFEEEDDTGCDDNDDYCNEEDDRGRSDVDCIDDRNFDEDDYNG